MRKICHFKLQKFTKLVGQIWFYSLAMLLALATLIWFVIPTALNLWLNLPHTTFGFKHIFSFIVFYSMGAYIKLYGSSIKLCGSYITQKMGIILSAIGILGAVAGDILVDVLALSEPALDRIQSRVKSL